MELYSSAWHLLSAFLVFAIGAKIFDNARKYFKTKIARAAAIYIWHAALCIFYCWYASNEGGDAIRYYRMALLGNAEFRLGTAAVDILTTIPVQGLGLSFLGTFLFFNVFGAIGLLAFDACLRTTTENKPTHVKHLATIIVFLPSISFWSSAIGKDSLSFMATGLALWASINLSKRITIMALAVLVMLLVRPHMAGMMVIGLTLASLLDPKASLAKKFILGSIAASATAILVPLALDFSGINNATSVEAVSDYIEKRQSYNMEGGGGIDIASMSLPMQLFTYMFRPFIFEARTVFAFAASIDNLILLYLFIAGGSTLLRRERSKSGENRVFMWTYAVLAWLVLAMTTANLGIALRQKWMFAPMLIFLFISVIGQRQQPLGTQMQSPPLRPFPLDRPKLRRP